MLRYALGLSILLPCVIFAQTFNGRITGTVTDAVGGLVPGATVTAKQVETNVEKKATTPDSGSFDIPLLLPGTYEVRVEAPGLQTQVRRNVTLEVNQTVTVDFRLPVSNVTTVVDVTADVPLLQTESSSLGTTLETRIVEDFPLPERDIMGLLRAIPGVVTLSGVGAARGSRNVFDSEFSIAGGRNSSNEVLLDGAPNTIGDFNGVVIVPPEDAVLEFRVELSSYSAEFGRSGGGVVNIVTKAGTNQYHGTTYYYNQNDAFDANSFTNNRVGTPKGILRRNLYGYTFGGPVWIPKLYKGKDRTFFFSSFEGRRESNPQNLLTSVPTDLQRMGDFSQTVTIVGGVPTLIKIYDPNTSTVVNGVRSRTQFLNNIIPMNRLNPVALKVIQDYPEPNTPGSSITGLLNYRYSASKTYARDLFTNRVDQYFGDKHRFFGRYTAETNLDKSPATIVQFISPLTLNDTFKNIGIDDTYQITTKLSNVFRYTYARFHAKQIPLGALNFDPTTLGLPSYIASSSNVLIYPNFSIAGPFPNIGGNAYNNQPRDTEGAQEQMLYVRGKHTLHFGGEYRLYRFFPFQVFSPTGTYTFGQNFTQPDYLAGSTPTQGFGLASFLLGTGSFTYEHAEPLTTFHHYWAGYLQDYWKVTPKLTLNLGMRWEAETGTGESHNRLSYFDPNASNPIPNGPKGAIQFIGNGNPDTIRATNWKDFGPRVGFAYRPFDKWVVRGGYGIFYLPIGLEPGLVSTPFGYTVNADVTNPDYTPKTTLSNPFPGGITKPASANPMSNGSYLLGLTANIVLRNQPPEYVQEWNFAVERQLARASVISASYYGSRGVHLPIPSIEFNQIDPKNLANGSAYLTQLVPNPYAGSFTSGLLAQPMIPREQLLKPFPQFAANTTANAYGGSLVYSRPPIGDSIYHAVTIQFERRFSKGLSVNAHYTFSKLIDTGGTGNGAAFTDPSGIRDIYNVRLERSISSFDVPQRLIVTYAAELPFGSGKPFLHEGKWMNRLVGGWSLLGFHTLQSGQPIAVGGPDLSRIAGASPSRVTVVPGVQAALPYDVSVSNALAYDPACGCTKPWFNPAAFTTTPEFVIPNGPRFLPNIRSQFLRNWDVSAKKRIAITEHVNFALEVQAYNVLNQVTFGTPSVTTVNSTNFGTVNGLSGAQNPRALEIGGRITF